MKRLMLALMAAFALLTIGQNFSRAEDRIPGYRYVDEPGDSNLGESKRTKAYNLKNELVGVTVKFTDGRVRNETYEKGTLRFIHETDFKGWSKDVEFNNGLLVTQTIHEKSGKSRVYVNVDGVGKTGKDIYLAVNDELYLVRTSDPWPGSRTDTVTPKLQTVLSSSSVTPKDLPTHAKLLSGASFTASSSGDNELAVQTIVITPGFAGHHGRPPSSRTVNVTIKVHVK